MKMFCDERVSVIEVNGECFPDGYAPVIPDIPGAVSKEAITNMEDYEEVILVGRITFKPYHSGLYVLKSSVPERLRLLSIEYAKEPEWPEFYMEISGDYIVNVVRKEGLREGKKYRRLGRFINWQDAYRYVESVFAEDDGTLKWKE